MLVDYLIVLNLFSLEASNNVYYYLEAARLRRYIKGDKLYIRACNFLCTMLYTAGLTRSLSVDVILAYVDLYFWNTSSIGNLSCLLGIQTFFLLNTVKEKSKGEFRGENSIQRDSTEVKKENEADRCHIFLRAVKADKKEINLV